MTLEQAPALYILAGPPGADKSSVLNRLLAEDVPIFDIDQIITS